MLAEYFGSTSSETKGDASHDIESGKRSLLLAPIGFEVNLLSQVLCLLYNKWITSHFS